jgi:uncharacterized protein YjbI with pentapeptide repeats
VWIANHSDTIGATLIVLGTLLSTLLLIIATLSLKSLLLDLISDDQRQTTEAAKTALPILAAAIGLPLIIWRLRILDRQTWISEEKTQIDRETHYTSIFSKSIDQLGQTREIKASKTVGDKVEPETRTVPSIEIRLGGIHSLVRLAEESARDRDKIENTLLSYVRENSWSDRNGAIIVPRKSIFHSSWEWHYDYSTGAIDADTEVELKKWTETIVDQAKQRIAWGETLKETRVDVKEAIDAIPKLRDEFRRTTLSRFYECIFVGVAIDARILSMSEFERCTFVKCTFDSPKNGRFLNSDLVSCRIHSADCSNILFSNCTIDDLNIHESQNCSFELGSCEITDLSIHKMNGGTLGLPFSNICKLWLDGSGSEITLDMKYVSLADGSLRRLKVAEKSDFKSSSFAKTRMTAVNLEAVSQISEEALATTKADPLTKHPHSIARPPKWDDYDADYKDPTPTF